LLSQIMADLPAVSVIIMTAVNDLEKAVECMKKGAFDFIVKPVEQERFLASIGKASEIYSLRDEISSLKSSLLDGELRHAEAFSPIITRSSKMTAIFRYIEAIAGSEQPVIITGETGVGKGLLARAVHRASGRRGEFIAVDVAGLDENMFSDTLFGHEKGAYTGAERKRDGLIGKGSGGTLFLDEIGDLNEAVQIKLLRLIEERTYYPLGSDFQKKSDARIVVATHKDIRALAAEGRFRRDLYYRLCSHHVHIPALRERTEDIPPLADAFLDEAADALKKGRPRPPLELYTLLCAYHFPGNIRELRALIYDAVAQHRSGMLSMESFKKAIKPDYAAEEKKSATAEADAGILVNIFGHYPTLKEVEEYTIEQALRLSCNNQGIASSMLGITRQALNSRLKRRKRETCPGGNGREQQP
ncbi:MAG: sigma-54 dependent transcriptional regulator, partial [Nitrospirota bacterium]|nr:sigma-54 dependent transcriptional regulator [Nitrospirota bacterium]